VNAGQQVSPEYILRSDITAWDVTEYKIKGYWYFDKRQSELKYRLLGICPVTPDVYSMNSDEKIISNCFGFSFHPLETFYMERRLLMMLTQQCYLLIKYWIRDTLIVLSTKKKMFTATGQLTITWR
jgi:hypothetical protein